MKSVWKYTIAVVCAMMVIAYTAFGIYMGQKTVQVPVCQKLSICFTDSALRQYVEDEEIIDLLSSNHLYPVGQKMKHLSTQNMEDVVGQHSMIRTCECYTTPSGAIVLTLSQRVPLIRVVTGDNTYFVDTDRRKMPVRESVRTSVLPVTGDVSQRKAVGELSDFAEWLQTNPYWQERIRQVNMVTPREAHLLQNEGQAAIILGEMNEYASKLDKLQRWYEGGKDMDLSIYPEVDIRYQGQVIGKKGNDQ